MARTLAQEEAFRVKTRDINLLPGDSKRNAEKYSYVAVFALLCLVLLTLVGIWWCQERLEERAALKEALEWKEINRLEKEENDLRQRLLLKREIWNRFSEEKLNWKELNFLLDQSSDWGVVCQELRYRSDELSLEGIGRDCAGVVALSDGLGRLEGVKRLSSLRFDYQEDGEMDFVLVLELLAERAEKEGSFALDRRVSRAAEVKGRKKESQVLKQEIARLKSEDEIWKKMLFPRSKAFLLQEMERLAGKSGLSVAYLETCQVPEKLPGMAFEGWECWSVAFEAYGPPEGVNNLVLAVGSLDLVQIQELWWKKEKVWEKKTSETEEAASVPREEEGEQARVRVYLKIKALCGPSLGGGENKQREPLRQE